MTSNILNSNDHSNQLNLEPKKISQDNTTQLLQTRRRKISSRPRGDILNKSIFDPGSHNEALQTPSKPGGGISITKPNENKNTLAFSPKSRDKGICSPEAVMTGCHVVPRSGTK